jgi:hypothetical protein
MKVVVDIRYLLNYEVVEQRWRLVVDPGRSVKGARAGNCYKAERIFPLEL